MFSNIYQDLKLGFNQSWFKFLFMKTALAELLAQEKEPSPWTFFSTYLSSWWWNRLWFKLCIGTYDSRYEFDKIIYPLQMLKTASILTEENFNLLANHPYPKCLASALSNLEKAQVLTPENKALVAKHPVPSSLASALSYLQQARILTPENNDVVKQMHTPG